ncbi:MULTISPECIES: hypothetical protein [unclassified Streptomyces]|uniref:hypothetical protein n=1 Tax=unclassified Streptomyces TaxID=2593676 RepID=UPI00403C93EB
MDTEDEGTPIAPLPDHRNVNTAWWQELWRRHAHITTPLRRRGLECDIEFGLSAYVVRVSLPGNSCLIISPPQEPPSSRPPGDPEGWSVTRQHPDSHEQFELIYDSTPSAEPGIPPRPEVRNGASTPPMIEAIDQTLARLGVRTPVTGDAQATSLEPTTAGADVAPGDGSRPTPIPYDTLHGSHATAATSTATARTGLPASGLHHVPAYPYGDALLALTDQLNATDAHAEAAALLHKVLEPTHGLLERLGEFFEAAGEKAKEADQDDGFNLAYDLADAAAEIRSLGEALHVAEERMRSLTPTPRPLRSTAAKTPRPWQPPPGLPAVRPPVQPLTPHRHRSPPAHGAPACPPLPPAGGDTPTDRSLNAVSDTAPSRRLLPHQISTPASDELSRLADSLQHAFAQYDLLNSNGEVPVPPPVAKLMGHVTSAQHLSQVTSQLATEFLTGHGQQPGARHRAVWYLMTAILHTTKATALFAQTVHTAVTATHGLRGAHQQHWQMVIDHADGRAELRRAGEAVTAAVDEINQHRKRERLFAEVRAPAPPTAGPSPRHPVSR